MYDSSIVGDTAALGSFLGGLVLCYILFILVLIAVMVFVYYKIFQKTGNSGWMALLMLVPLVNLGMILFLAFSDWPVLRENRDLKARLGYPPSGGYPPSVPATGRRPPTLPSRFRLAPLTRAAPAPLAGAAGRSAGTAILPSSLRSRSDPAWTASGSTLSELNGLAPRPQDLALSRGHAASVGLGVRRYSRRHADHVGRVRSDPTATVPERSRCCASRRRRSCWLVFALLTRMRMPSPRDLPGIAVAGVVGITRLSRLAELRRADGELGGGGASHRGRAGVRRAAVDGVSRRAAHAGWDGLGIAVAFVGRRDHLGERRRRGALLGGGAAGAVLGGQRLLRTSCCPSGCSGTTRHSSSRATRSGPGQFRCSSSRRVFARQAQHAAASGDASRWSTSASSRRRSPTCSRTTRWRGCRLRS